MVCREGKGWGSRFLAQGGMNIYGEGAAIITPLAISVHPSLPLLMGVAGTGAPIPHPPSPIPHPPSLSHVASPSYSLPVPLLCSAGGPPSTKFSASLATGPGRM